MGDGKRGMKLGTRKGRNEVGETKREELRMGDGKREMKWGTWKGRNEVGEKEQEK